MKLILMSSGKPGEKWILQGVKQFEKRLKHYLKFELREFSPIKKARKDEQLQREAQMYLEKIRPQDRVLLLDERGKVLTSRQFAAHLEKHMLHPGQGDLILIIGGPYGFDDSLRERADGLISLSAMTFTHDMACLFLLEQLYRAMTILRGEPYHHD